MYAASTAKLSSMMIHNLMNVTRRTCGYLGENFWNVGKTKEIKARVLHL